MNDIDYDYLYTSANANDLSVGDTVILANSLYNLKLKLEDIDREKTTLSEIKPDNYQNRFVGVDRNGDVQHYNLAYKISGKDDEALCLKVSDLRLGDTIRRKDNTEEVKIVHIDHIGRVGGVYWIYDSDLKEDWNLYCPKCCQSPMRIENGPFHRKLVCTDNDCGCIRIVDKPVEVGGE